MPAAIAVATRFETAIDYRDELAAKPSHVRFVTIPRRRYLAVDGGGAPGSESFRDAMSVLYPVAYTLHFALKRRGVQAPVGALEGLYWIGDPGPITVAQFSASGAGPDWSWRLLLPLPDEAMDVDLEQATADVRAKGKAAAIDRLAISDWQEDNVAQTMHVGPYDAERPTIEALHAAIAEHGLVPRDCHHEIYISDPNRTALDRLKTLIRQPVEADT